MREIYNLPLNQLPIRFKYNDKDYQGFGNEFTKICENKEDFRGGKRIETLLSFKDNIAVKIIQSYFEEYGESEATVYFTNNGDKNTGVFSEIATYIEFEGEKPVLKGILGDHENLYRPYEKDLTQENVHFVSDTGRATHINFPYFNLEHGNGGTLLAIGWAGTWTSDFHYNGEKTIYQATSVNGLSTYLKPGESIRTALFVAIPYEKRDENYATNLWRKWFINCSMPRADKYDNPVTPFSTCCLAGDTGLPNSDGSISERYTTWRPSLEKMFEKDCKVDFRWFDAGWYSDPRGRYVESDWWGTVGSWVLDKEKWPGNTFRESTDFAREHGMKTLMWFEPERVTDVDGLVENYGYKKEWAIDMGSPAITNNIGNEECFRWTSDRICKLLRDNKVEMYREDNNSDPAALWNYLDAKEGNERRGITECRMIEAHYKLWDEIIETTKSFGGCGFCDSCASGGGRNDIESLRRGIPLLRSDSDRESTALRLSMTSSFNKWIPYCGAISKEKVWQLDDKGICDQYTWRASYLPVMNLSSQFVQDPDQDFEVISTGLKEWRMISNYLTKDFYVHTPWKNKDQRTDFTSYSFFDSEEKAGYILAFRMEGCEKDTLTINLPYVDDDKTYTLTDVDTKNSAKILGKELKAGYSIKLLTKRSAKLIKIAEITPSA